MTPTGETITNELSQLHKTMENYLHYKNNKVVLYTGRVKAILV